MTTAEKIVHYGSLTVNLGVLCFAGWLFYKSEMHSPQTVDGPTCIVRLTK